LSCKRARIGWSEDKAFVINLTCSPPPHFRLRDWMQDSSYAYARYGSVLDAPNELLVERFGFWKVVVTEGCLAGGFRRWRFGGGGEGGGDYRICAPPRPPAPPPPPPPPPPHRFGPPPPLTAEKSRP
jgi:hypothetical protein